MNKAEQFKTELMALLKKHNAVITLGTKDPSPFNNEDIGIRCIVNEEDSSTIMHSSFSISGDMWI